LKFLVALAISCFVTLLGLELANRWEARLLDEERQAMKPTKALPQGIAR